MAGLGRRSSGAAERREEEQKKELRAEKYYHGILPRENAAEVIRKDGEWLLRYNDKDRSRGFVISGRWQGTLQNFKILSHNRDGSFFIRKDRPFPSVKELVEYYVGTAESLVESKEMRLLSEVGRERWELKSSDVVLETVLGRGSYGETWKGRYKGAVKIRKTRAESRKSSGSTPNKSKVQPVAVKLCKDKTSDTRLKFEKEGMFLLRFHHKNIVQTVGIVVSENPMMIVLEYMPKGSLLSYLTKKKKELNPGRLRTFCLEAAEGMAYLESQRCIHRDVAARSCLIGAKEELKISDFGLAKSVEKYKMLVGKVALKWMAPESLKNGDFTSKSDVWSYGVLMWEIFALGEEPWSGLGGNEIKKKVLFERVKMAAPPKTPQRFANVMTSCWEYPPQSRPSFAQILLTLNHTDTPSSYAD